MNKKNQGYTLAELVIVLALISCLSFAVFKGARVGISSLNLYIVQKQAVALAQLMKVDYELAAATGAIHTLHDFIGTLYTRQWPVEANSFLSSGVGSGYGHSGEFIDLRQIVVDNHGCIQAQLQLKPCWSASEGIRVEVYNDDLMTPVMVVRSSALSSNSKTLVGLGMDAIMVQNHYFQQHVAWSDLSLEDADEQVQARGRQR